LRLGRRPFPRAEGYRLFRTERGVPGENNLTAIYEIESEFHKLITSYVGERAA
jgi:hypothetical protein